MSRRWPVRSRTPDAWRGLGRKVFRGIQNAAHPRSEPEISGTAGPQSGSRDPKRGPSPFGARDLRGSWAAFALRQKPELQPPPNHKPLPRLLRQCGGEHAGGGGADVEEDGAGVFVADIGDEFGVLGLHHAGDVFHVAVGDEECGGGLGDLRDGAGDIGGKRVDAVAAWGLVGFAKTTQGERRGGRVGLPKGEVDVRKASAFVM